jgi:Domain of unknown function DUF29
MLFAAGVDWCPASMAWARDLSDHGREGGLMSDLSYETDVYAWAQRQAQALRAKDWSALDVENLAEEIESLGHEQAHAVESHLRILLA